MFILVPRRLESTCLADGWSEKADCAAWKYQKKIWLIDPYNLGLVYSGERMIVKRDYNKTTKRPIYV